MSGRSRRLVIMAKEPRMGRVKSRLAKTIGIVPATMFQRVTLERLIRDLGSDPRWQTLMAVAPDTAVTSPMLPPAGRIAQGGGDLGDRMARVFSSFPDDNVLITGADIPAMTRAHIDRAFRLAEGHGAVLGPSGDGGYWCVGLRGGLRPPAIFQGVRWSTEHALADTLLTLPKSKVGFADQLDDVDG
ncbi:MAG: DUF2064 domain-containing protein [Rhodobiaceae bacterium]|nr:DUF2064 domain-containing protein [Rhodobiaceae bacterium]MCC0018830.1 DUF2064 domain-containing protein [Rhodobiaceae bacterium]MCC0050670.1 DUF2064 domain-containing protein [Rhodobiaceae bacterium]MCC0059873.1 DUF2064 domain-containing protein [Rhodobiaceae bacterium]